MALVSTNVGVQSSSGFSLVVGGDGVVSISVTDGRVFDGSGKEGIVGLVSTVLGSRGAGCCVTADRCDVVVDDGGCGGVDWVRMGQQYKRCGRFSVGTCVGDGGLDGAEDSVGRDDGNGVRGSDGSGTTAVGSGESSGVGESSSPCGQFDVGGVGKLRGKNYWKNKVKSEKRKLMKQDWRGSSPSISTVRTVDTRTAVELEAAQTLAARRVAENKVAEALAEHKLRALKDKDRTVMVDRLAAARGEQRINEAKAKSQASYKKCDQSLKSLGSSGSAGEFALKQEVKRAKDNEAIRLYVEKQAQMFAKYATPDVLQLVAAIPPPVLQDEFEAFGECPSEYGEDEQEAYFDELNRRNEENFDRCATYC